MWVAKRDGEFLNTNVNVVSCQSSEQSKRMGLIHHFLLIKILKRLENNEVEVQKDCKTTNDFGPSNHLRELCISWGID